MSTGVGVSRVPDLLVVPPARVEAIHTLAREFVPGRAIALSTHVSADGDGCGSEAAFSHLLAAAGLKPRIVNPTPWPTVFNFVCGPEFVDRTGDGVDALGDIDVLAVLDISDVKRLGGLAERVRALTIPKLVIDHHLPGDEAPSDIALSDTVACATGELIFDLAVTLGWPIDLVTARALYLSLLTDTGSFRHSNSTPRCHAIAAYLISIGVNPEATYQQVYGSMPMGRLMLLREALAALESDGHHGLAWISLTAGAAERHGLKSEDLDGIVDYPRSVAGTRLALFFRDLGRGKVKVSFRSTGDVDANKLARQFGGGGHVKASGALIDGHLDDVRDRVVAAAKAYLGSAGA